MATRKTTTKPQARKAPAPKAMEARDLIAQALLDVREAAAMLRTTAPLTYDSMPDHADEHDFVHVARAAQKCIDSATNRLGQVSIECSEIEPRIYRACNDVCGQLFNTFDAIACGSHALASDFDPKPGERHTESAPGGAFACAAFTLGTLASQLESALVRISTKAGAA